MAVEACSFNKSNAHFAGSGPPSQSPEQVFKINLSLYANKSINREVCIKNCCSYIEGILDHSQSNLVHENQKEIDHLLSQFLHVAGQAGCFSVEEFIGLGSEIAHFIENKWCQEMAKSFYSIPSFTDETVRRHATEKWAKQFFQGVDFLLGKNVACQNWTLIMRLMDKTQAFLRECHLNAFENRCQNIINRLEKDPKSMTASDRQFIESGPQFYFDQNVSLMKQAVEKELTETYFNHSKAKL